jgi:hypothetical protein
MPARTTAAPRIWFQPTVSSNSSAPRGLSRLAPYGGPHASFSQLRATDLPPGVSWDHPRSKPRSANLATALRGACVEQVRQARSPLPQPAQSSTAPGLLRQALRKPRRPPRRGIGVQPARSSWEALFLRPGSSARLPGLPRGAVHHPSSGQDLPDGTTHRGRQMCFAPSCPGMLPTTRLLRIRISPSSPGGITCPASFTISMSTPGMGYPAALGCRSSSAPSAIAAALHSDAPYTLLISLAKRRRAC